ncbi:glutamate-1-semialdehyde-2,1-aminomutase [Anseongella ginsenosidimutans]|nr:glutamate-1-semialdehyde-2,1-aminomutase [Anseongella ginsenosidimutans]
MTVQQEISRSRSDELFEQAKKCFPGGVNSPVRAFKSVEGVPLFIKKGEGCHIWDEDDNQFIDFCCSWGPLILGHNHQAIRESIIEAVSLGTTFGAPTRLENELAELIRKHNPHVEKLRFVSSGTEAVMSAIRLARGFTGRDKILKFEGCYHGHADSLLVKAGSGLVTFGETTSAGVPEAFARETIVAPLNNMEAVKQAFKDHPDEIAAVIIEGIPANNGLLIQEAGYMQELRECCTQHNALLILDEVITGFRLGMDGAAGYYDIRPDLVTYGKVIGGGMPVGCYGGSAEVMGKISPDGPVYQAGTLSGNPVAMAAGIAQLKVLQGNNFYKNLNSKAEEFAASIERFADARNYPLKIQSVGSLFWFAFAAPSPIRAAAEIDPASMGFFKIFHRELLNRGVYLGPSGYEVGFVSAAHSKVELEKAKRAIFEALEITFKKQ